MPRKKKKSEYWSSVTGTWTKGKNPLDKEVWDAKTGKWMTLRRWNQLNK